MRARSSAAASCRRRGCAPGADGSLEVELNKEQNLNELFALLSARGIEVLSMRNKANRLEELFLRLVEGRDAATGKAAAGSAA